jgi:hypothetical protein
MTEYAGTGIGQFGRYRYRTGRIMYGTNQCCGIVTIFHGSSSDFWKTVVPVLVQASYLDHKMHIFSNLKFHQIYCKMWMKKMLNEGSQICCVCENFFDSGSGFATAKSYGSYGSGSATLIPIPIRWVLFAIIVVNGVMLWIQNFCWSIRIWSTVIIFGLRSESSDLVMKFLKISRLHLFLLSLIQYLSTTLLCTVPDI